MNLAMTNYKFNLNLATRPQSKRVCNINMKNIFFFLIINLFYLKNLHSQTLFFSQGNIDIRDKTVVSVLNQIHNYNSNIYNRFDLDIDKSLISNRLKIGFQYSNYFNYAGFSFEPSGIGFAGDTAPY